MQDLGVLPGDVNSAATSINDRAQVIGELGIARAVRMMGNPRAFLWENGVMTDLNTLVPGNSPLYLLIGSSINSRGRSRVWRNERRRNPCFPGQSQATCHRLVRQPTLLRAVVTPLTLITNQSSVVLDGSGSTSASGNLQYLFTVVSGGLKPALLQTPNDPKATVDFVSGPGTIPGSAHRDGCERQ